MVDSDAAAWSGPIIAAVCGAMLPRPDRLAAMAIGVLLYWLMFHIPQGGADSPVNGIAAYCSAGFALGAFISTLVMEIATRLHKQPS
jgi:hypothetical protein